MKYYAVFYCGLFVLAAAVLYIALSIVSALPTLIPALQFLPK